MKRNTPYALLAVLLACCLAACDDIAEDERFSSEPIAFEPSKNVLIEDFTGQNCLNCPNAADATHALQELYGEEHVIAVAIHGGELTLPLPYDNPYQLATETGNEYNRHWGVTSWPSGMVDRTGGLLEYTSWSARAVQRLQQEATLKLHAATDYDAATRRLSVSITAEADDLPDATLQVWLVEDSITGLQRMPDGTMNRSYLHNHVFRAALNGDYGEPLAETATLTAYTVPENYDPQHLAIVAFAWNEAAGVLQATRQPLTRKE